MKRLLVFLAAVIFTLAVCNTGMAAPAYWESNYGNPADNTYKDDEYDLKPIGFDFNFFGTAYDQVAIGSNGLLAFGGNDGDSCQWLHQWDWKNTGDPAAVPVIAPLWTDWYPVLGGEIYYNTLGMPGNRRFTVTYDQMVHSWQGPPWTSDTFQVTLFENGIIAFGYCDLAFNESSGPDNALVGVSNGAGNVTSLGEGYDFNEGTLDNQNRWLVYNGARYEMFTSQPVPIPGAVYLLGSGLVGLVGIRRKLKKSS